MGTEHTFVAISFTGTDGIKLKTTTMDAVLKYDKLDKERTINDPSTYEVTVSGEAVSDNKLILLPKVQIIVATKSAQAGISSNFI